MYATSVWANKMEFDIYAIVLLSAQRAMLLTATNIGRYQEIAYNVSSGNAYRLKGNREEAVI